MPYEGGKADCSEIACPEGGVMRMRHNKRRETGPA